MTALAVIQGGRALEVEAQVSALPALVLRASQALANAVNAAEVLDAKATAAFAYDAAKAAARFAKSKGAFDEVMASVYRSQADALEIEAMAKRRLADEYDAAQDGGQFAKQGEHRKQDIEHENVLSSPKFVTEDIGLSPQDIYDLRKVRDAEVASPGIHKVVANDLAEAGIAPTRRAVGIEINTRLNSFSGDNEWYTPAKYIEMAREVMGSIDVDPASNATAQAVVQAKVHYTIDTDGLSKDWLGNLWMNPPYSNPEIQNFVEHLIVQISKGNVKEAIVLTNNSGDTGWHHDLQASCSRLCITKGRIRFESPTRASNSPAMGQSFFYFGDNPERFKEVFSAIGTVWAMA